MTQHVFKPTRHRGGQESSVLDLVFTLDPNMVTDLEHLPPLGHSDHEALLWSYICYSDPQVSIYSNKTYNYFKGDYDALNDYLFTIDWGTCYLLVMTLALTGILSKTRFLKGVRSFFLCLQ